MNSSLFVEGTDPIYGILSSMSTTLLLVTRSDCVHPSRDLMSEKSVIEATFSDKVTYFISDPFAINIHFYSPRLVLQ
jgi:hypothetical protein